MTSSLKSRVERKPRRYWFCTSRPSVCKIMNEVITVTINMSLPGLEMKCFSAPKMVSINRSLATALVQKQTKTEIYPLYYDQPVSQWFLSNIIRCLCSIGVEARLPLTQSDDSWINGFRHNKWFFEESDFTCSRQLNSMENSLCCTCLIIKLRWREAIKIPFLACLSEIVNESKAQHRDSLQCWVRWTYLNVIGMYRIVHIFYCCLCCLHLHLYFPWYLSLT